MVFRSRGTQNLGSNFVADRDLWFRWILGYQVHDRHTTIPLMRVGSWDVTGYSDPFRPLKVPIFGRLLEGVHKKKAVLGGCLIAKTGHQKGKKRRNTGLLF